MGVPILCGRAAFELLVIRVSLCRKPGSVLLTTISWRRSLMILSRRLRIKQSTVNKNSCLRAFSSQRTAQGSHKRTYDILRIARSVREGSMSKISSRTSPGTTHSIGWISSNTHAASVSVQACSILYHPVARQRRLEPPRRRVKLEHTRIEGDNEITGKSSCGSETRSCRAVRVVAGSRWWCGALASVWWQSEVLTGER